MVKLLLENGADCNVRDKQERRPLHWASYLGYTGIIRILVEYGADVNCLDKDVSASLVLDLSLV
jgi:ankyrin repeat protein